MSEDDATDPVVEHESVLTPAERNAIWAYARENARLHPLTQEQLDRIVGLFRVRADR